MSQYFDFTDCRFYLCVSLADNGLETKWNESQISDVICSSLTSSVLIWCVNVRGVMSWHCIQTLFRRKLRLKLSKIAAACCSENINRITHMWIDTILFHLWMISLLCFSDMHWFHCLVSSKCVQVLSSLSKMMYQFTCEWFFTVARPSTLWIFQVWFLSKRLENVRLCENVILCHAC